MDLLIATVFRLWRRDPGGCRL